MEEVRYFQPFHYHRVIWHPDQIRVSFAISTTSADTTSIQEFTMSRIKLTPFDSSKLYYGDTDSIIEDIN